MLRALQCFHIAKKNQTSMVNGKHNLIGVCVCPYGHRTIAQVHFNTKVSYDCAALCLDKYQQA